MYSFINFIVEYRDIFAFIISVILSVIIMVIKKKPVINEMDKILLVVLEKLPEFINEAESFKGADVKKTIVLESVKKYVEDQFSVILPDSFIGLIGSKVEAILSTPQKK